MVAVAVVPGGDTGAGEVEVAGARTGGGATRPVVAVGAAGGESTVVPVKVPAPEEGERCIFYQSV